MTGPGASETQILIFIDTVINVGKQRDNSQHSGQNTVP